MRFFSLPLLANVLFAVSFVAARPIRVEIASFSSSVEISEFRLGQGGAAQPLTAVAEVVRPETAWSGNNGHKKGCAMNGMRLEAIKFSNWLRGQLGLPMIESPHKFGHKHHQIISFKPLPQGESIGSSIEVSTKEGHPVHHHAHHHKHDNVKSKSFFDRLHKALMTLGVWEGRLVAFVIGCGIGSLFRMVWVLLIILLRAKKTAPDTTPIYVYVEEVDEIEPPKYSDEKSNSDMTDVKSSA